MVILFWKLWHYRSCFFCLPSDGWDIKGLYKIPDGRDWLWGKPCLALLSRTAAAAKSLQSCPTLCDPIDGSPPGSAIPRILQGKNTRVGCHFLLQCMKVKNESEVAQSCLTLHDPMDCSLPGSSVHGIFQARVLEWGSIAFSTVLSKSLIQLSAGRWVCASSLLVAMFIMMPPYWFLKASLHICPVGSSWCQVWSSEANFSSTRLEIYYLFG